MRPLKKRVGGRILASVLGIVGIAAVIAALTYFFYCPCARTPGGWLLGDEISAPVGDWSFVNDRVRLCQIQVSGWLPHSVNLNCMAADGELYLSCAGCDGKTWSTYALAEPEARIRMNEEVYPVTLRRVQDPVELAAAWNARAAKLGRAANSQPAEGWWSFHVTSRSELP